MLCLHCCSCLAAQIPLPALQSEPCSCAKAPDALSVLSEVLLQRYPSSESVRVAAAAVLARDSKQEDALALLEGVQGRGVALTRAQLALDVGNAAQVVLPNSDHQMLRALNGWS